MLIVRIRGLLLLGAAIAVAIIGTVRGLPEMDELVAADGGALPMTVTPTPESQ